MKKAKEIVEPVEVEEIENDVEELKTPLTSVAISTKDLAEAIVSATEQSSGVRRRIPFGQQKIRSPFNPTGNRNRKLKKVFYQAGFRLGVKTLTDAEIDLLHKLKPGLYIDNLVRVIERQGAGGEMEVFINYSNSTADQRMALGSRIGGNPKKTGLQRMLEMILAEYEEQKIARKAAREAGEID